MNESLLHRSVCGQMFDLWVGVICPLQVVCMMDFHQASEGTLPSSCKLATSSVVDQ